MNGRCRTIVTAAALAALACGAAGEARAQAMDPEAERARQLVLRIRRSMKEIDALLLGGAAPEKIESELAANQKRLQQLLDDAESKSGAVMQQLDELIEMSKSEESKQQSPSGGESGGEPPPKGGQGQQGKSPERERSQDPQELQPQPQDQPGGQKPEPKGQEEKQPRDGDPKNGSPDPSKGEQRDAKSDPPLGATGEFERTDLSGRWGMLPDKEAELLQRRSVEEFPQRYRVWMEQYFRRVSRLPARD